MTGAQIREIRPQAVLGNTYHLMLQPGEGMVEKMGGLAKMMDWNGPTFTDSGGFQVFSLGVGLEKPGVKFLKPETTDVEESKPRLNKITEEGVKFQSHIDGSSHMLSPETSISIQEKLGADLIVGFDDLESPTYHEARTLESLELTERWLLRSLKAQKRHDQLMYGVTHGGQFENLRKKSAEFVNKHFDAIALGGAHASKNNLYEVISWTTDVLDEEKPRHLLGIGEVDDIFMAVERGIDTFDCVIQTRLGRMGHVFVSPPIGNIKNRFRFDITKSKFASDLKPIDENCECYVCNTYPRAYINHLFRSRELLAYTLASYHNVYFTVSLINKIRASIINGDFNKLKLKWLE
jgi:queuine tRNA-ribosyltransferase/7-cyano-7-deazaguanine tRNA-ribosyltransferase